VTVSYRGLLAELGIERAALIGLGFGGWIAAETAIMAPGDVARLVLDGPIGIKPSKGDILDQAFIGYSDYALSMINMRSTRSTAPHHRPISPRLGTSRARDVLPQRLETLLEALHV
jgi:pimeloyl-ACP methyl ester carboxylesterase